MKQKETDPARVIINTAISLMTSNKDLLGRPALTPTEAFDQALGRHLLVGQEVKCETLLLKPRRPQTANFGQACVDVPSFELHPQFASLQHAEAEEVLDIAL